MKLINKYILFLFLFFNCCTNNEHTIDNDALLQFSISYFKALKSWNTEEIIKMHNENDYEENNYNYKGILKNIYSSSENLIKNRKISITNIHYKEIPWNRNEVTIKLSDITKVKNKYYHVQFEFRLLDSAFVEIDKKNIDRNNKLYKSFLCYKHTGIYYLISPQLIIFEKKKLEEFVKDINKIEWKKFDNYTKPVNNI